MGKKVRSSFEVPGSVEDVFAFLTAEDFAATKAAKLSDGSRLESRDVSPDGAVTCVVTRALPDGLPGFLEKFLPAEGRAKQTEVWGPSVGGAREARFAIEIPGTPARIGGTMRIEPVGTGSRYTLDGEVKVPVPVLGGKIEGVIADIILKVAAEDADLVKAAV
jgi:hypothetical protein